MAIRPCRRLLIPISACAKATMDFDHQDPARRSNPIEPNLRGASPGHARTPKGVASMLLGHAWTGLQQADAGRKRGCKALQCGRGGRNILGPSRVKLVATRGIARERPA